MKNHQILTGYLLLIFLQTPMTGGLFSNPAVGTLFFATIEILFLFMATVIALNSTLFFPRALKSLVLLLALFFLWAFLSGFWTSAGNLNISLALLARDAMRLTTVTLLMLVTDLRTTTRSLSNAVSIAAIVYPMLFYFTATFEYEYGNTNGRLGYVDYRDANGPARDLGLFIVLLFWVRYGSLPVNKLLWAAGVGLTSLMFLLSFSKTVFLAVCFTLFYQLAINPKTASKKLIGLLLFVTLTTIFVTYRFDYFQQYLFNVQGGNALRTVTGRTVIWEVFWNNIADHFLFGAGVNSFETFASILPNKPGTVHNDVLNVVFNYGLIGLSIVLLTYLKLIKAAFSGTQRHAVGLVFSLLVFFSIIGLTESNKVSILFSPYLLIISGRIGSQRKMS